jgi:hypothetical protein
VIGEWPQIEEANYEDCPAHRGPGWLDHLLAGETVLEQGILVFLGVCCFGFPLGFLLSGLGLLVCRTAEARQNAAFLLVMSAAQVALFLWVAAVAWAM